MANKNFIKEAIKKPGSLTATAKKKGGISKEGTIKEEFLEKASSGKYGKKTEQRANFAKTLKKMKGK